MNELINKYGLNRIKGWKSWTIFASLLSLMIADQFIFNVPFANLVFPALVLAAVILHPLQSILLAVIYGVFFELYGCLGYYGPVTVIPWTIEVVIGFLAPVLITLPLRNKANSVALSGLASLGEFIYFWVSIIATYLISHVFRLSAIDFMPAGLGYYILNDLPFELYGCAATFICSLLVFIPLQLVSSLLTKPTISYKDAFARSVN